MPFVVGIHWMVWYVVRSSPAISLISISSGGMSFILQPPLALCLCNDDPDLVKVRIGWPLPNETAALVAVVQALSCNTTVERLDIRQGDENLYPDILEDPWWYGRQEVITELLISALEKHHYQGDPFETPR